MATLEQWQNRKTTRMFDKDKIPDIQIIKEIENCLNYLPIQVTENNPSRPNHVIFRLGPTDSEIKKWLVENLMYTPSPIEYFTEIYEAPYVYLFCDVSWKGASIEPDSHTVHRNIGFTAGVLISEALSRDLDTSQLACVKDTNGKGKKQQKLRTKVHSMLHKRFKKEISTLQEAHGRYLDVAQIEFAVLLGFRKNTDKDGYIIHKDLQKKTLVGSRLPNRRQPFMFAQDV